MGQCVSTGTKMESRRSSIRSRASRPRSLRLSLPLNRSKIRKRNVSAAFNVVDVNSVTVRTFHRIYLGFWIEYNGIIVRMNTF
jgi:hypothetical protein